MPVSGQTELQEESKMNSELSGSQNVTLRALCDTFVPSIQAPDDPIGFWARTASDIGADRAIAKALGNDVPEKLRIDLVSLLDDLSELGFVEASQDEREAMLGRISKSSPKSEGLINYYQKQTLLLTYGLPEEPVENPNMVTYGSPQGQNPNWEVMGYPGPVSVPHPKPKQIRTITPPGDTLTLDADVCIVGSGAGGAAIAAKLSACGRNVVVLEAGGHYNSGDFHQLELWGYRHLWYRGGATPTINGTVALLAGGSLGGGTEINWMNCVRTPALVREDWARQYGLAGLDDKEFDVYLDDVERRIMSSTETSYYNAQNLRMKEGCDKLNYLHKQTHINWDPQLFNPLMAGYTGFGDQTGGKQTVRRTFLLDAFRNEARFLVHCHADRILMKDGRASGVDQPARATFLR